MEATEEQQQIAQHPAPPPILQLVQEKVQDQKCQEDQEKEEEEEEESQDLTQLHQPISSKVGAAEEEQHQRTREQPPHRTQQEEEEKQSPLIQHQIVRKEVRRQRILAEEEVGEGRHRHPEQLLLEEQRQSHPIRQQTLEEGGKGRGEEKNQVQRLTLEEEEEEQQQQQQSHQSQQSQQDKEEGQERKEKDENKHCVRIKALLFARARELSGHSEITLELETPISGANVTASDCVQKLIALFPNLQQIRASMVVALNQTYVAGSAVVKDGDELALIPPISGG